MSANLVGSINSLALPAAHSSNSGGTSFKRTASNSLKAGNSNNTVKKPPVDSTGWCYTRCKEDTNYSFAWTIEGFRRKMEQFSNGQCLTSDVFNVMVDGKETAWKLECFPNGKQKVGEDTVGAVSVFLYPVNQHAINRYFTFSIGFVNEDNSRVMKGKGEHCFRDNQNGWGWLKLVTHQTLKGEGRDGGGRPEGEKLLPNDALNILCVMKFRGVDYTTSGTSRPAIVNTSAADEVEEVEERKNFLDLFETGDLADIEVLVEGQTFKCHSAILAGQSQVFRAMLLNDMREKATRQIRLAEIDAAAVRAVLTYCYGGQVAGGLATMADRLLKAADQYDLGGLKRQCERALCQSLTIANCLDHLVLADLHSATILKPFVTKFVVENAQEVTGLPNWREKLTMDPDIFTEVFSELASTRPSKKFRSDEPIHWSLSRSQATDLDVEFGGAASHL